MTDCNKLIWKICLSTLLFNLYSVSADASGFALTAQGVKGLGNAYAGAAASADDASTVFYNPAGMTHLKDREFIAGAQIIQSSIRFNDSASKISSAFPAPFGGVPLTGSDGDDGGGIGIIPNLYYTQELSGGYWFGLGINSPFGEATKYDDNWKGRYQAIESKITSLNINPSIAYRVNDAFSVGGGANLQYLDAKLTQAVDFSAVCLATPLAASCTGQGVGVTTLQSPATTGFSENTADDWAWGYNVGFLYELTSQTRVGMAYRSKIDHKAKGQGDFTIPTAVLNAGAGIGPTISSIFADAAIQSYITLPETLSLSGYHQINNKWAVMGDVTRTNWSRIPEVRISFDNPLKSDSVERLNWKNSTRYSAGANYAYNDRWTLRGGVAYDQTPIYSTTDRTARLPDNDRRWLAFGATYMHTPGMSVDVGYVHEFISNTPIDRTGVLGDKLVGSYQNQINILGVQAGWKF